MPQSIALIAVFSIVFASGEIFPQEVQPLFPAIVREGKVLRLEGEAVTKEAIAGLAGGHWRWLHLSGERVDAGVIEGLRQAASIRSLELNGARISGQIPRLQHVSGLVELKFNSSLDGRDIDAIGELTELESLKLPQDITINMVGAQELARLTKLKSLELYGVNLDDAGLAELATLVKLEHLDLTHTRVTDVGLKVLANFPNLKTLELQRHPAWLIKQQLTNDCLAVISRLPELERLSLSGKINNEGFPQLARLRKLKHLSILGTDINAAGLAAWEDSSIESLMLSYDQLGGFSGELANLKNLKKLKSVWVSGKNFSEEFMNKCRTTYPDIVWAWHS